MSGDRLDAFAMMFRAGADLPPAAPPIALPDWAVELMCRGRRWGRSRAALDAIGASTTRADRLATLARALNVPAAALEVEAANHYTALLPDPGREWQARAFEHFDKVCREAGAEVLEQLAERCYPGAYPCPQPPCPPFEG